MKRWTSGFVCVAVAVCAAVHAQATVWNESTDAGDLVGTAEVITGSGPLTTINGVFPGPDDVDLYQIQITDPNTFSASGTGVLPFGPPKMFLFDATGIGVTGYDDSTNTGAAISSINVTNPGLYFLAYSGFSLPEDFTTFNNLIWLNGPQNIERVPDGSGAAAPLGSWSPAPVPFAPTNYAITLTGAAFVPEPGTAMLLLAGMGIGAVRRRR